MITASAFFSLWDISAAWRSDGQFGLFVILAAAEEGATSGCDCTTAVMSRVRAECNIFMGGTPLVVSFDRMLLARIRDG